jgi:hypothetical protein
VPTPTELTIIVGLVVTAISSIALPMWFRRQTDNQLKAKDEKDAKKLKAQEELAEIKKRAERDAAAAVNETVSWEKINQALRTTAREERAAHGERLSELREAFAAETDRLRRQTDRDLDRANDEIRRLGEQVQALTRQIAELVQTGHAIEGGGSPR